MTFKNKSKYRVIFIFTKWIWRTSTHRHSLV